MTSSTAQAMTCTARQLATTLAYVPGTGDGQWADTATPRTSTPARFRSIEARGPWFCCACGEMTEDANGRRRECPCDVANRTTERGA